MGVVIYLSTKRNTRPREEYRSVKWGEAAKLNHKYVDKHFIENKRRTTFKLFPYHVILKGWLIAVVRFCRISGSHSEIAGAAGNAAQTTGINPNASKTNICFELSRFTPHPHFSFAEHGGFSEAVIHKISVFLSSSSCCTYHSGR